MSFESFEAFAPRQNLMSKDLYEPKVVREVYHALALPARGNKPVRLSFDCDFLSVKAFGDEDLFDHEITFSIIDQKKHGSETGMLGNVVREITIPSQNRRHIYNVFSDGTVHEATEHLTEPNNASGNLVFLPILRDESDVIRRNVLNIAKVIYPLVRPFIDPKLSTQRPPFRII